MLLARSLAVGTALGALLGLLAGPHTDTGTGVLLVLLGAVLGCGVGGLVAVGLDVFDVQWPERPARTVAAPEPVLVEEDLGPLVPAGWYPDPAGGGEKRYWDGERWG